MRNEVLRDVLAGCAGVLAVTAAIGLPTRSAPAQQQAPAPVHGYVLLPKFTRVAPTNPSIPRVPSLPRVKITTSP
jgi:hypothetical protein